MQSHDHTLDRARGVREQVLKSRSFLLRLVLAALLAAVPGCITPQKVTLVPHSQYQQVINAHKNAVIATIKYGNPSVARPSGELPWSRTTGRKFFYLNLVFEVAEVLKGHQSAEQLTFTHLLANNKSFWFTLGERYLIAFDGSYSKPKKVTFVPIATRRNFPGQPAAPEKLYDQ